jgi:DNA-binding Lrp family transcriptional regulator
MTIYKSSAADKYTVIPNETMRDNSISFEATGLLCFLLSLPADWAIHKSWLQKQKLGCGRDKLTRLISELEEAGYIKREVSQLENGKLNGYDWYVHPTALLKNRNTDNPTDGKPATTKERSLKKKDSTNLDQSKIARAKLEEDSFEYWWKAYPKKVAKASALKSWKKVIKKMDDETVTELTNHIVSDVEFRLKDLESGNDRFIGFDRLHATTYLNQERYNDDY